MSNYDSCLVLPDIEKLFTEIMLTVDVAWHNNRIDRKRIEGWLDNFTEAALGSRETEQRIALWLLYNFVYYNEDEVKQLCKNLLAKYLHIQLHRMNESPETSMVEIATLINKTQFLNAGYESESGAYILYLFRQENDLPLDIFKKRETMSMKYEHYAFIDDVSLSGQQAISRIDDFLYYDCELTERDITFSFSSNISAYKAGTLGAHIREKIEEEHIDFSDNQSVCEVINRVFINSPLLTDTIYSMVSHAVQEKLDIRSLVSKRIDGQLPPSGVRKLNRLLIEYDSPDLFYSSVNNTQITNIHLLVLFATDVAINTLRSKGIDVIYCIKLDEQSKAFSNNSVTFSKYPEMKEICKTMCEHYGQQINPKWPLGYRDGQLLMSFYYSVPNNTLPIFWRSENWIPLFPRHDKRSGGEIIDVFGRYI